MKKEGRSFDCAKCPVRTQKLRRCHEDRNDFDIEDGSLWPMYVTKGGDTYGFCPAKATWDLSVTHLYNSLMITAETGNLLYNGAIMDQPNWYIDLLGWFLPRYDTMKFTSKADMILGGSGSASSKKPGPSSIRQQNRSRR